MPIFHVFSTISLFLFTKRSKSVCMVTCNISKLAGKEVIRYPRVVSFSLPEIDPAHLPDPMPLDKYTRSKSFMSRRKFKRTPEEGNGTVCSITLIASASSVKKQPSSELKHLKIVTINSSQASSTTAPDMHFDSEINLQQLQGFAFPSVFPRSQSLKFPVQHHHF